ncbi:aldo/keto reductase [Streptomyces sp. NPDC059680]|uniref:aldo/keto reductase n=1 Tax=Streptomyces sp. NPDC059680 TaxID=3346904 RepID=UPI003687AB69
MHNAQPWHFRYVAHDRALLLLADLDRAMTRSDPGNRALHIGCGAALFNLRVAAARAGFTPVVRLLPDAAESLLLAAVQLGEARRPMTDEDDLARLHPAIRERHTRRHPFDEKDIPEGRPGRIAESIAFVPFFPFGGGRDLDDERLVKVAARHGATLSQIGLAWLLACSPATLAIPGTGSLSHLEQNMAAAAGWAPSSRTASTRSPVGRSAPTSTRSGTAMRGASRRKSPASGLRTRRSRV